MFDKMLSEKTDDTDIEEDDDTIIDVGKMSPDNRQVVGSNLCQVGNHDEAFVRVSGADSSSEKQHNMVSIISIAEIHQLLYKCFI